MRSLKELLGGEIDGRVTGTHRLDLAVDVVDNPTRKGLLEVSHSLITSLVRLAIGVAEAFNPVLDNSTVNRQLLGTCRTTR